MPVSTAILCRTNAPLIKCAFALLRRCKGIKIKFIGRDVAKSLKDVIADILGYRRNCTTNEFNVLLDRWIEDIRVRYEGNDEMSDFLAEQEDFHQSIKAIAANCKDALGVYELIDKHFVDGESLDDDPSVLVFASGHRSKGLEWTRVIWIRPDLCPHPSAKDNEDDLKQEEHLKYIIGTRGMETFLICHGEE